VHHEDSDPMQLLDRVRWTDGTGPGAVSNGNTHTDRVGPPSSLCAHIFTARPHFLESC
jgi:hypothetical protein